LPPQLANSLKRRVTIRAASARRSEPTKGYGFIQPDSGGKGRVHPYLVSAVEKAGLGSLNEGAMVSLEEVPNKGKTSAENLRPGLKV
jgi:cold shock protein